MAGVASDALPGHFCPQRGQFQGIAAIPQLASKPESENGFDARKQKNSVFASNLNRSLALKTSVFLEIYSTEEVNCIRDELDGQLDKHGQRKLLEIVDLENRLCEDISLASFVAGFRLAWGISKELG